MSMTGMLMKKYCKVTVGKSNTDVHKMLALRCVLRGLHLIQLEFIPASSLRNKMESESKLCYTIKSF